MIRYWDPDRATECAVSARRGHARAVCRDHGAACSAMSERLPIGGMVVDKQANRYLAVCSLPKFLKLAARLEAASLAGSATEGCLSPANPKDTESIFFYYHQLGWGS